jgi:hypothetical protein
VIYSACRMLTRKIDSPEAMWNADSSERLEPAVGSRHRIE